jgi:nitroreductase
MSEIVESAVQDRATSAPQAPADDRARAVEAAADQARLAPSVHNTQPWTLIARPDRLEIRADRSRQLTVLDPTGRELVQSVGAALFNARAALAAAGWTVAVERIPDPADPDLLALVAPLAFEGDPDSALAVLAPEIARRRTNRRRFTDEPVPDEVVGALTSAVAAEGAQLIPVLTTEQRLLIATLTQQADAVQTEDPAYRAELERWTTRPRVTGDGVPASAVPLVDGSAEDDVPIRAFGAGGAGGAGALPARTRSSVHQTMVVLATRQDDPEAWLRSGEALQRLLLELTRRGLVASPITQALETVPTRARLGEALTWEAHPQMLLRIGSAEPTEPTARRPRTDVLRVR